MHNRAIRVVLSGVSVGLSLAGAQWTLAADTLTSVQPASSADLTEQQKVVHVLNRLGFGPRPGDVERVTKMGIDAYIQQQLHPETIDDSAVEKALEPLDTLKMGSNQLLEDYWTGVRQFIARQKAEGNAEDMKLRYGIDASNMKSTTKPEGQPAGEKGGAMAGGGGSGTEAPATASLRCPG